jgi:hypothetical protein
MTIGIHYNVNQIQQAMRHATKEVLFYMITEAPDNEGNCPTPRGFVRHSDGHLSPDFDSSDYDRALESVKEYVLHASYIIDAWRGKPKGSAMEVINEAIKTSEYQYFALEYAAKALTKTIIDNNLYVGYYLPDRSSCESGSGYPDFERLGEGAFQSTKAAIDLGLGTYYHEIGEGAHQSTLEALRAGQSPDLETVSIVEAAAQQ